MGDAALLKVPVLVTYEAEIYRSPRALAMARCLLPEVPARVTFEIECIDVTAEINTIGILVLHPEPPGTSTKKLESNENAVPLVASRLTMPKPELLLSHTSRSI